MRVTSIKDLTNQIIPHFDKYPLITQKRADFELFKQVVDIMNRKEHLTTEGLNKIVSLRASMNWGLSEVLKESFPEITPVPRPEVSHQGTQDPNWLAGFSAGECCFYIYIQKSSSCKLGKAVSLRFGLTQHSRDTLLINGFIKYLGCGRLEPRSNRSSVDFIVTNFSDIYGKIIPFFEKYPILGCKYLDYVDFCKVAELMKTKAHLTQEGLDKISLIKSGMNSRRDHGSS